jgi:Leucine-rich repeat (LRR) protein
MAYRKINNNNVSRTRQQRAKFKSNRTTTTVSGRTPGSYYSRPSSRNCNPGEVDIFGVCYDPATTTIIDRMYEGLSGPIPDDIQYLQNLTTINFQGNGYITSIPESIGALSNLKFLYLGENQISSVPSSITNLHNLEELDLSQNHLNGDFPDGFYIGNQEEGLSSLKMLNLGFNNITTSGQGGQNKLMFGTQHMYNLESLYLYYNDITQLPDNFLYSANNIHTLALQHNNLTSMGHFADSWYINRPWFSINLRDNGLTGNIPGWICQLLSTGQLQPMNAFTQGNNFSITCQGDVNDDWNYDILDVVTTVNRIMSNHNFTPSELWFSDMNSDGNVNITDVIAMVQQLLGTANVSSSDRNQLNQILNQVQGGRE